MSKFDKYYSLEFEDRGRGPRYDCWGLVRLILAEQFGLDVPSYAADYQSCKMRDVAPLIEVEAQDWQKVAEPKEGDVILLRLGGRPFHCGLMISADRFIHIEPGCNVVVESIHAAAWNRRIAGFIRHKSRI